MISAIVLAGGRGKRMNYHKSKQFIEIKGKPVLVYTLEKFIYNKSIDEVILVLPEDEVDYCKKEVLQKYSLKVDRIVIGGKERQDSVFNALEAMEKAKAAAKTAASEIELAKVEAEIGMLAEQLRILQRIKH